MKFTSFEFKNFKGIKHLKLDLGDNNSKIYTLVGLNESGKTTILEAINFFIHKSDSLNELEIDRYQIDDIHDIIPIHQRDNFNDSIKIEAVLILNDEDINQIKEKIATILSNYEDSKIAPHVSYTQTYFFENSQYIPKKTTLKWSLKCRIKKKGKLGYKSASAALKMELNPFIREMIPSILYFPNFLFEFPSKIYLEEKEEEPESIYRKIIQDILDALNKKLDVQIHIIDRINSNRERDQQGLESLLNKMNKILSDTIFSSWNKILGKLVDNKKIIVKSGKNDKGVYIEFNVQDSLDTYKIGERSLGFRWFFTYLLLTQFRNFRNNNNNALFLFDEPGSNLHSSAQMQLLESFNKLPAVIYTTHSHYLINPHWLENTYIVKNIGFNDANPNDFDSKNSEIEVYKYKSFVSKHSNQTTYFQPILDVLDYSPSNLDIVPNAILVEGKTDFYAYKYFFNILLDIELSFFIIPCTSASNMQTIISLYLGWGKNFLVILDSDKEGIKQRERYLDLFGESLSSKIISYEEISSEWKKYAIEKLISEEDRLKIQQECYPETSKYDKKNFNRSIQELLIKKTKVTLSEFSTNNFKEIFDFIKSNIFSID
jgi:predicted ATP-dependent endonuclease of OLD family